MPADLFEERIKDDRVPYDKWKEQGIVTLSGESKVDYKDITKWFLKLRDEYDIYPFKIGYDGWSSGVGRIFGYTVVMDGGLADGQILFGNGGSGMVQNTNEPLSIQSQKDLSSRETIYLGYMITDWAVLDNKAFGLLEEAGE